MNDEVYMPVDLSALSQNIQVPEGCELVVALRAPNGQLVALEDLEGGVEVAKVPIPQPIEDPEGEVLMKDNGEVRLVPPSIQMDDASVEDVSKSLAVGKPIC